MHYIEADLLDWGDVVAVPHFWISLDDDSIEVKLDFVMIGTLNPRGGVDGLELTPQQAERIWGAKLIEAWEEHVGDNFDVTAALADEEADRGDDEYEKRRDEEGDEK